MWKININIISSSEIKFIKSSSHDITNEISESKSTANIKLKNGQEFLNKDFTLLFANFEIN